jgi:hypothetical protein
MVKHTINSVPEQRPSDFETLNELGEHIHTLMALMRAVINVDTNHPDDEGWLVSLAYTKAKQLEDAYSLWAYAPSEVTK